MSGSDQKLPGWSDEKVDSVISFILRSGLIAATAVVIVGTCIHFIVPETIPSPNWHQFNGEPPELRTISGIVIASLHGQGRAIMQLGVLLLLATPILRVIFAAYAFARQYDYEYVVISLLVLAALMFGIFTGGGGA